MFCVQQHFAMFLICCLVLCGWQLQDLQLEELFSAFFSGQTLNYTLNWRNAHTRAQQVGANTSPSSHCAGLQGIRSKTNMKTTTIWSFKEYIIFHHFRPLWPLNPWVVWVTMEWQKSLIFMWHSVLLKSFIWNNEKVYYTNNNGNNIPQEF